ncbi:MAG: sterol desaturase family protein [Chloroherpetonaceae bacterium]|nr:sterol desaturase family protein [Chloroherpetonaceae bacterium]
MSLETLQWVSPLVIVSSAIIYVILERIFPYDKGLPIFREGFFNDLVLYTLIQSAILGIVINDWIINNLRIFFGTDSITVVRNLPLTIQVIFFLIIHDIYIYFFHRWQHRNKWLFRTHEAHHSPRQVDWLAGSRSHFVEILINQTIEYAPILLFASPEVALWKGMLDAVWGMYIHSNIDVRSGVLQYVINGPEMHRWHHSKGKGNTVNFATKIAIWDWIFGTAYLPNSKPKAYGLTSDDYPLSTTSTPFFQRIWDDTKSYVLQTAYLFRPVRKSIKIEPKNTPVVN